MHKGVSILRCTYTACLVEYYLDYSGVQTVNGCPSSLMTCRLRLKYEGTRAETRFSLSAKRTSPFKSVGSSVQSITGSRVVRISGSNAGYTMFRGSVKGTGYPLHSPVSPSLPLPCVTVCHHVSTGLYLFLRSPLFCPSHVGICCATVRDEVMVSFQLSKLPRIIGLPSLKCFFFFKLCVPI